MLTTVACFAFYFHCCCCCFFCLTFTFVVSVVVGCSGVQGTCTQSRTCKAHMIYQTSSFNQDLSKWNVGKVTSMPGMLSFLLLLLLLICFFFNFYFCCFRCFWVFRRTGNVDAVTNMQAAHALPNECLQPGPVEV